MGVVSSDHRVCAAEGHKEPRVQGHRVPVAHCDGVRTAKGHIVPAA